MASSTLDLALRGRPEPAPRAHLAGRASVLTEPESATLRFYWHVRRFIHAIGAQTVVDLGAGAGSWFDIPEERAIRDLRDEGQVWACDRDPAVLQHPAAHHCFHAPASLPFDNASVDLILCDCVFEHVDDPTAFAAETMRVLRPGGVICVRTPNALGYPALAARMVPNRLHAAVLRYAQPDRKASEIFPTRYRLNRLAAIVRSFPGCDIEHYFDRAGPAYYFGSTTLLRLGEWVHQRIPEAFAPSLCCFIRKPAMATSALEIGLRDRPQATPKSPSLARRLATRGAGALLTPFSFMVGSGHLRSALLGKAVDRGGRPIPWYSYPAIDLLRDHDLAGKRVLEFGGGQSTRWWVAQGADVITVEEDAAWAASLSGSGAEVYHLPIDREHRSTLGVRRTLGNRTFDVIVIDGHLREECSRLAVEHLAPRGALILDNSEHYGLQPAMAELGLSQVHLWGYAPGVWRRQCTTIAFRGECFLFSHSPRSSTGN